MIKIIFNLILFYEQGGWRMMPVDLTLLQHSRAKDTRNTRPLYRIEFNDIPGRRNYLFMKKIEPRTSPTGELLQSRDIG
jgi:hypothetical protein